MSACIMGHGSEGCCEHCPGDAGRGADTDTDKRLALAGSHSDRRAAVLSGAPRGWESLDDNRTICGECGAYSFGECICGDVLPIAEEMDDSREELRVLDASLSLDAVACAEGAVHAFAECIETDVRYVLHQIEPLLGHADVRVQDRARRAIDALERVEGQIAGVWP